MTENERKGLIWSAEFLAWERASRDTVDFKKTYVDMAEDFIAGALLSQIVYWNLPGGGKPTKLRVFRDDHYWLVKGRDDWWDELRLLPQRFDTACAKLIGRGLVIKTYGLFNNKRMMHLRINWGKFEELWNKAVKQAEGP